MAQGNQSKKSVNRGQNTKTRNKPGRPAKAKQQPSKPDPIYDEITIIVTLVISVLLILSYFNLGGKVSDYVNTFTFGLMGLMAYLFPFVLFLGVAFGISNRNSGLAKRKIISSIAALSALSGILHLIVYSGNELSVFNYYSICGNNHQGGGMIGAIIGMTLQKMFGTIGAYIILIAAVIILFILVTGKLLFSALSRESMDTLHKLKERKRIQERYEDSYENSYEEERPFEERPRRKAKTFTFDTQTGYTVNKETGEIVDEKPQKKEKSSMFNRKKNHEMEPAMEAATHMSVYEQELQQKFGKDVVNPTVESETETEPDELNQLDFEITRMNDPVSSEIEEETPFEQPPVYEDVNDTATGEELISESNHQPRTTMKPAAKHEREKHTKNEEPQTLQIDLSTPVEPPKEYIFPPLSLLSKPKGVKKGVSDRELKETALKLQKTLESFGVKVTITNVSCGPTVTRYELQPEQGVKVSKITNLADDIKLNLAAADVRIEAPIPGKAAVGIEVPNKENSAVMFRELIESKEFKEHESDIAFAVGKDIGGQTVVTDIAKMPHLLIAGATGSGKSVCINTLIMSILYKANPADVKLIMVDPKVVELSVYNGIPHLLIPVVTDPKKASAALNWAVMEMTERYQKFANLGVRDIKGYNKKIATIEDNTNPEFQKMPQIVIIVDELADLMMVAPGEVEDAICRLAQMARAAGLHLIIATQRPSVNVITGLIKANVPSRIAFSVSSAIDSRTILDGAGAEKLLGKGDMLFFPSGFPKPVRLQGAFVSDREVSEVVEFLSTKNASHVVSSDLEGKITNTSNTDKSNGQTSSYDEYFVDAGKFIIEKDKASIGMLQRVFKIGFNRAARIMDQLNEAGVVGPEEGTKPRKVLMSMDEFEQFIDEYV